MNSKQRSILKIVLVALILMFIFPPFHVPVGQGAMGNSGFSFILSPPESQSYATPSVNAMQLVAQWVGVVIIGAVAFLLKAGPEQVHSEEPGRWLRALGEAFRRSKKWLWPAVVFTAMSLLWVGNPKVFAVKLIGHAGAALLVYVVILFWHWTRAMRGIVDEDPTTTKKYSLKRILTTIAVGVIVAAVFIFSFADRTPVMSKLVEPGQSSSNPFDRFDSATSKKPWELSWEVVEEAETSPQKTTQPKDLFEEAGTAARKSTKPPSYLSDEEVFGKGKNATESGKTHRQTESNESSGAKGQSIDEFLGIAPKTDKQIPAAK